MKKEKTARPISVTTPGHKRRRLVEPVTYRWTHNGDEFKVVVPADGHGFEVSAPRPLRALAVLVGPYYSFEDVSAAHDYLYRERGVNVAWVRNGGLGPWRTTTIDRKAADAIMLSDEDDPLWLRYIAWAYVRLVGWFPWNGWDDWFKDKIAFWS